jgi:hypothetical protein
MAKRTILFVGTHDGLSTYRAGVGGTGARIIVRIGQALSGHTIQAITATDAETLVVALADMPPQQSFDGGQIWMDAGGEAPAPVEAHLAMTIHGPMPLSNPRLRGATAHALLPGRPATLIGAGAGGMIIFHSTDDGIHWEPAQIVDSPSGLVTSLIPDPNNPRVAWAGTDSGALLRSGDQGKTWRTAARENSPIICLAAVADGGEADDGA